MRLIGYEAWENIRLAQPTKKSPWIANYKWPIYFFVAVAFWNMVGAGLFGFLINPPISLYYVQGLNLTPVHGHTALVRRLWNARPGPDLCSACARLIRAQSGSRVL